MKRRMKRASRRAGEVIASLQEVIVMLQEVIVMLQEVVVMPQGRCNE